MDIKIIEAFLRLCSTLLLLTNAFLVRFDTQTSLVFPSYSKTATFRDMNALYVLVFIDIAAAGYNMVQLIIGVVLWSRLKPDAMKGSYKHVAWISFLLDKAVVYMIFASTSAALTASLLAVTGEHSLFWMKLCNKFTRFCAQIGGALLCGFSSLLLMAIVSSLSAFSLFRLYSPKRFLDLK